MMVTRMIVILESYGVGGSAFGWRTFLLAAEVDVVVGAAKE